MFNILFIQVYCDESGWTLVARFSNTDHKNWLKTSGEWWYDITTQQGNLTHPADNKDAIFMPFWILEGTEFKITRTDDANHTALLTTTSGCLGNKSFRDKITGYGDFRNGTVWGNKTCKGSCDVTFDGQYASSEGFNRSKCTGKIGGADKISFWCDWQENSGDGDGSVLMIGGGGDSCGRADHGIGITEKYGARFNDTFSNQYDFGDNTNVAAFTTYGLNLWVK